MTGPIVLPQAPRYKTIAPLINRIPGNVGQIQNIFTVDDNSFAVFLWDAGAGWFCWVIDVPSLSVTYYASTGNTGNLQSAPIPYGSGNFLLLWNDGSAYSFNVRNLKLNNPSPILVPFNQGILSTICFNGIGKIFYSQAQRLITVASYYPNGGAGYGPVFSHNYSMSGGLPVPLGPGGYAGWYTSVPPYDPWDRTVNGPAVAGSQISSNGILIGYGGNPTLVSRTAYRLIYGAGGTVGCPASVFNGTATPSGDHVVNDLGTTLGTGTAIAVSGYCDSNIPGLVGLADNASVHLFGDDDVWFQIPLQYGGVVSAAITKNYIAGVIAYLGMSIGFFQTPAGLYNGSSVNMSKFGLTNFSRPVSVIGKYRA